MIVYEKHEINLTDIKQIVISSYDDYVLDWGNRSIILDGNEAVKVAKTMRDYWDDLLKEIQTKFAQCDHDFTESNICGKCGGKQA